nr:hypothetical protein [Tanacetum cinerariifolium]
MRTCSSSNLPVVSPSNLSTLNPKRRKRRHSKQPFILEESPIDTMADQRTMAELLRAPTEGYAEAIMVPPILAEQFKLKHSLINMMNSDQFFRLEKDNPHDHIRCQSANEYCNYRHDGYSQTISSNPPPASVKSVEEIYVTCGGAHLYYQCLAAGGNTFSELQDNIQGYVSAAAVNYNQGNSVYRPPSVILKKLPEKLGDPRKFLIPCGFSELKCKALADLVGKFTFPSDFVIVDYESDPRVPFILGRPFLRTARALIDVHSEEMILCDGDERLTLNMRHDTSSYSNQPQKESINLINVFNNSSEDFLEDLFSTDQPTGNPTFSSHPELTLPKVKEDIFDSKGGNVLLEKLIDLDSTKDLHPSLHVNLLSGSTTYSSSSNPLLEELADELALITFPPKYDDDLYNLSNPADNFVNSMPEMFIDEHALDYSSPLIFDEYDDDFLEVESYTENVYDDPFDSKGEKIKESKLLIDELDLLCDFLPSEYDSFISRDFSRVDALPSTNNEDKVFNPGILIQEKPFEIITRVVQDKKLATSNASLVLEDFDPPLYEPLFFKEVPRALASALTLVDEAFANPREGRKMIVLS